MKIILLERVKQIWVAFGDIVDVKKWLCSTSLVPQLQSKTCY